MPLVKAWEKGATNLTDLSTFHFSPSTVNVSPLLCTSLGVWAGSINLWVINLHWRSEAKPSVILEIFFFFNSYSMQHISKEYTQSYHVSPPPLLPSWCNSISCPYHCRCLLPISLLLSQDSSQFRGPIPRRASSSEEAEWDSSLSSQHPEGPPGRLWRPGSPFQSSPWHAEMQAHCGVAEPALLFPLPQVQLILGISLLVER